MTRVVSLAVIVSVLAVQPACLLLRRPADLPGGEVDTDLSTAADTDAGAVDSDSAASHTDAVADTDLPVNANQAPTVGPPVVGPQPAYNTSTLTCAVTASDPDGTAPTVSYAWLNVSSGADLGVGASVPLTASLALPGENVRCTATASDGRLWANSSDILMIEDRAPEVSVPLILPSSASTSDTLTCSATAGDPDGTTPTVTYAWTDETKGTLLGTSSSVVLSPASAAGGDQIRCLVTASDRQLSGASYAEVVLSGGAPQAPAILGLWSSIPAGEFDMGCETGRDDVGMTCATQPWELPVHHVTLTRGFWMMQSEVTQEGWTGLMGNTPSVFWSCGASCPVDSVTWWDAVAFANAASAAEGLSQCYSLSGCGGVAGTTLTCTGVTVTTATRDPYDCAGYRLPTEAEYEYAARGGTANPYPGSSVPTDVSWFSTGRTKPTCTKATNPFGLCDLSGNVQEWLWDWYGDWSYVAVGQADPLGPSSGVLRCSRGGDWSQSPVNVRIAARGSTDPSARESRMGFRLVRSHP